jgi:hypothetical protein
MREADHRRMSEGYRGMGVLLRVQHGLQGTRFVTDRVKSRSECGAAHTVLGNSVLATGATAGQKLMT